MRRFKDVGLLRCFSRGTRWVRWLDLNAICLDKKPRRKAGFCDCV